MSKHDDVYKSILTNILERGKVLNNGVRNGNGTIQDFLAHDYHFDMRDGSFPLITMRKQPFRWIVQENKWFFGGDPNTKILEDQGITIWKGNTTREALDKVGLYDLEEGDSGRSYPVQLRSMIVHPSDYEQYNGLHDFITVHDDGTKTVDQLAMLLHLLKTNPYDRRTRFTFWHPEGIWAAALPSCHCSFDVAYDGEYLHGTMLIRSWDVPYGGPFNIAGYAFQLEVFSKYMRDNGYDCKPGVLKIAAPRPHIYQNQLAVFNPEQGFVEKLIERPTDRSSPSITINKELLTLEDVVSLDFEDVALHNYNPYPDFKNKPDMAA